MVGKLYYGLYNLFNYPNSIAAPIYPFNSYFTCDVSTVPVPSFPSIVSPNIFNNSADVPTHSSINKQDILWHYKLGHTPFSKMKYISDIVNSLSRKQSFTCPICPLARKSRLPFAYSTTQSSSLFDLVYVDTWGPYHDHTYDGFRYFLTILMITLGLPRLI